MDIDTKNNRVLVISRYGLDCKPFDGDSNVWADSEICSWLNGDFYNTAFDDTEREFIKPVDIIFKDDGSDNYNFDGSTYNVFLLSKEEAEKYFANDNKGKCEATAYAVAKDAYVEDGYSKWWLRSLKSGSKKYVYRFFLASNEINFSTDTNSSTVVLPALWINL